jgi:hypothetical protein
MYVYAAWLHFSIKTCLIFFLTGSFLVAYTIARSAFEKGSAPFSYFLFPWVFYYAVSRVVVLQLWISLIKGLDRKSMIVILTSSHVLKQQWLVSDICICSVKHYKEVKCLVFDYWNYMCIEQVKARDNSQSLIVTLLCVEDKLVVGLCSKILHQGPFESYQLY